MHWTRPRRRATGIAVLGLAPLALSMATAAPAVAHGSMSDPVSRVAACFAEGPENPQSDACKAAVAAGGTQPFYDWNEVNIANAAGEHREIIPDGELCSAGREKYQGLDLPRNDWPSTGMTAGAHTFRYKATAPHRGSFELYLTKEDYDPTRSLTWSDLEEKPFAEVTDPQLTNGAYVIDAKVPERSGRHLVYSIWQRSDSPEAFYTCSDVVFGGGSGDGGGSGGSAASDGPDNPAPAEDDAPAAPSDEQISAGADKSTVDHGGHGGDDRDAPAAGPGDNADDGAPAAEAVPNGGAEDEARLAETGGDDGTTTLAMGGAAALTVGCGALLMSIRRRAAAGRHRG